jgi:DNA-3-methyladenine glycosylase
MSARLPRRFFARPTLQVARDLLGCRLVRRSGGRRLAGVIVEVEAYIGEQDLACHCRAGRTPRTTVMFGKPGLAYVYFTYGMHWMLNVVTEREGFAAAVLIRALAPVEGVDVMTQNRSQTTKSLDPTLAKKSEPSQAFSDRRLQHLCSGPARLTQALRIDGRHNGVDLCARGDDVWIEAGQSIPPSRIRRSPRVGVDYAPEPWRSKPWRFFVKDSPFVSK